MVFFRKPKSLEELKRENSKLKAQEQVREDFRKRQLERRRLEEENRALRNPRRTAFLQRAAAVGKRIAQGQAQTTMKKCVCPKPKRKKRTTRKRKTVRRRRR